MTDPASSLNEALGHAISDKRLQVLRLVSQSGSISQAAREAGISYKAAWQAIDTLTNLSGVPLVDRTVGGSGGGGARITAQGLELLALADALAVARRQVLAGFTNGLELASGLGLRTSMRNQLRCTVQRCEALSPTDPLVWIELQTAGGALMTASLTHESADLLGLQAGLSVLVLCKATAVRMEVAPNAPDALPLAPSGRDASFLRGEVARVTPGQGRDEVVLALPGGGHWVGFAAHPLALTVGQTAVAHMAAAALVVGLA
ncbi:MAG: LysR family transcriptional regulator [Rhodoferax sp.]|uniref:TOBE domain-containing protein n=1 Tax=Rhodoferax sp. TaxID=50421 RepID=UPI001B619589|nr:TOBE domain-containing protein [Rhodoferax sp.]MBP9907727.1 LysR family transcriptional regulator [Rhodoferax sp.]